MSLRTLLSCISFLLICAIAILLCPTATATGIAELSVSAKSAVLLEADDGDILYQKNANEQMGMASTTKIMTALVVCENIPLSSVITIPEEAVNTEGSSVYLTKGELLSAEQLLYALLLASANDAAVALAIAVCGSVEAFAKKMNEKASELGLKNTSFKNPHGLYEDGHYTTAYDLALIARAVLKNDDVRRIVGMKKARIPQGVTPQCEQGVSVRYLQNHNKMLSLYDGAIGLKTGFTKKTGRCLVSAAVRNELCLIAVTLNAPDDWNDHTRMLDYGFASYEKVTLFDVGEFSYCYPVCAGKEGYVILTNTQKISFSLPKGERNIRSSVLSPQRFEFAPVKAGDHIAYLKVWTGQKSAEIPLVASYSVQRK